MGIQHDSWSEKYAFAYFWGMSTLMGFGNAVPSNPTEAIVIAIIQVVSGIMSAYIINHVGNLLSNIAKENETKEKNLKTSRRLAKENDIGDDLLFKINNFICQTSEIESNFNYESDRKFIGSLPLSLRSDFVKDSNKRIFRKLTFFKMLTEKTLMDLAEKIVVKITHPQEIIFESKGPFKFLILKTGDVGFFSKNIGRKLRNVVIDRVHVKNPETSVARLLSLSVFMEQP